MRARAGGDEAVADAASDGDDAAGGEEQETAREKVIVRSNGVVTYVGKDIANQFWKLGLLGRDFRYRLFLTQANGQVLWATTSGDGRARRRPRSVSAARIYNVIDSRQMYLQALLSQALRALGHPREAENSIHFSYEMVALSHRTARELGYATDEAEQARQAVRRGVRAEGARREDRRPARPADRQGGVGGSTPESGVFRRRMPAGGRPDRRRARSATSC